VGIGLLFTWNFLVCFTWAGEEIGPKIRNAYMESILKQDIVLFDTEGAGEVTGRTTKDIATIRAGIGQKLGFTIWCFTTMLVGIIIGSTKAARMAGVLLSLIPLFWACIG
jgi:ATP-binding cassette subfamily B (MDR/TAP) protein 1